MNADFVAELRETVLQAYEEMRAIPEATAAVKAEAKQWSSKEILGHLIDSAANNHQRFVRLQIFDAIEFPFYQQDDFVRVNAYQKADWQTLLDFWKLYNLHLAHILEHLDHSKLTNIWLTPDKERLTLEHIITDYLRHLRHHLAQIRSHQ